MYIIFQIIIFQNIFWIYIAAIAIQLLYYWFFFSRFAFYKKQRRKNEPIPVSIVISAKNEYLNLSKNLPLILKQDYPDFEVVVVNDASDDETIFFLEDIEREDNRLKVVNITQDLNFFSGKKFPLALGIKSAKNEYLLLTDADCTPCSEHWIKEMVSNFSNKTDVVLGYGKYKSEKGFLNKIIRYETVFTAIQYFSYALIGIPYMGVGRNLAYKKSLFIKSKGFISHYDVSSGDDDLFINKVANKKNTQIEINPDSFTMSAAKQTWLEWKIQKKRHLSTGKYYKLKHKILLSTYHVSLFFVIILFLFLIVAKFNFWIVLLLFLIRLFSQILILKKSLNKLNEKKLLLISPIIELMLVVIYPVLVFLNLIFKQNKWK
ncbi:MAG: glycosyltransferase [Bacteroidales bacterium]|nr:glycosyltransferase [Bacteroidales bacterium]